MQWLKGEAQDSAWLDRIALIGAIAIFWLNTIYSNLSLHQPYLLSPKPAFAPVPLLLSALLVEMLVFAALKFLRALLLCKAIRSLLLCPKTFKAGTTPEALTCERFNGLTVRFRKHLAHCAASSSQPSDSRSRFPFACFKDANECKKIAW